MEMITYLSVTTIRTTTTIQRGIRINGDSLTQYCSEKARNASAWFESSKAIMAESFATGSDHQVINELNGERLREPNEVFKRFRSSN